MKIARWGGPPCPPARGGQGRAPHQHQSFFIFRCVRKEMIVGMRPTVDPQIYRRIPGRVCSRWGGNGGQWRCGVSAAGSRTRAAPALVGALPEPGPGDRLGRTPGRPLQGVGMGAVQGRAEESLTKKPATSPRPLLRLTWLLKRARPGGRPPPGRRRLPVEPDRRLPAPGETG